MKILISKRSESQLASSRKKPHTLALRPAVTR